LHIVGAATDERVQFDQATGAGTFGRVAGQTVVSQIFTSWNRIREWLRRLNAIQRVA